MKFYCFAYKGGGQLRCAYFKNRDIYLDKIKTWNNNKNSEKYEELPPNYPLENCRNTEWYWTEFGSTKKLNDFEIIPWGGWPEFALKGAL